MTFTLMTPMLTSVALATDPVFSTCAGQSLRGTLDRMVRWSMLRARVQPLAYLMEPLSSPLMILGVSPWLFDDLCWPALAAFVLTWARDAAAAHRVRRTLSAEEIVLSPLRELMWLCAWTLALGRRDVQWRGHRLRVSAGTRLYPLPNAELPR